MIQSQQDPQALLLGFRIRKIWERGLGVRGFRVQDVVVHGLGSRIIGRKP